VKLFAVAGELSGDAHGGALLEGLRARLPGLRVTGIGGPCMLAQGLEPLLPMAHLQVHGLLEVVRHLPRLYRILWRVEAALAAERPDAVLLVDYPGFNLKVARAARRLGLPVYHYSAPQVWAWRRRRIRTVARCVSRLIVLLPFEEALFRAAGVDAVFLGHPLVGQRAAPAEVAALRERLGPSDETPLVAVMPGSRPSELARHLPTMLDALGRLAARGYRARYVLPLAESLSPAQVAPLLAGSPVPVHLAPGAFLPLLQLADLAMVASGTATLQVGMAGIPFVVIYKVSPLSYHLARRFATVRHFAMVNILAGREIVPELLQERFTADNLAETFAALATDPARQQAMRHALAEATATLGEPGAYGRAAALIAEGLRATAAAGP